MLRSTLNLFLIHFEIRRSGRTWVMGVDDGKYPVEKCLCHRWVAETWC
jgi:hypothetical protein